MLALKINIGVANEKKEFVLMNDKFPAVVKMLNEQYQSGKPLPKNGHTIENLRIIERRSNDKEINMIYEVI